MYTIFFILYNISYIVLNCLLNDFSSEKTRMHFVLKNQFFGICCHFDVIWQYCCFEKWCIEKIRIDNIFLGFHIFKYSKSCFSILFSLIYYSLFNNLEILEFIPASIISLVDIILNLSPKVCYYRSWSFIKTNSKVTGRLKFIISCLHESWTKIQN